VPEIRPIFRPKPPRNLPEKPPQKSLQNSLEIAPDFSPKFAPFSPLEKTVEFARKNSLFSTEISLKKIKKSFSKIVKKTDNILPENCQNFLQKTFAFFVKWKSGSLIIFGLFCPSSAYR